MFSLSSAVVTCRACLVQLLLFGALQKRVLELRRVSLDDLDSELIIIVGQLEDLIFLETLVNAG